MLVINVFKIIALCSQIGALFGVIVFLYRLSKNIKVLFSAAVIILAQHREMWSWYLMHKTAKLEMGKDGVL